MGASGSGKSVIQHSLPIDFMTNCTTRHLRDGEVDGYHIKQVTEEEFLKLDDEGYFFETTVYSGNYYGTPNHKINEMINGKPYHCTKDLNGVRSLKEKLGDKAVSIYIKPPSIEELKIRMINRGDSQEDIERRINYLQETNEIDNEKYADYVIVNEDLKESQLEAHKIIIRELMRMTKNEQRTSN
jgi:guanylate kinase